MDMPTPDQATKARDTGPRDWRAELVTWLPIIAGLCVLYVPSLVDLFKGVWSNDEQMHGPIVLGISVWLLYRNWPAMMQASEGGRSNSWGWLFAVFALLLYIVGTTDSPGWYRNFEKPFWEDPSEHLKRSPIMYVGNVKTPTMLMTGVQDLRTPMPQTEEFYSALKYRKVPTAMIRFNNEWHGTSSTPSNFLRTQLYLRSWFERWPQKVAAQ